MISKTYIKKVQKKLEEERNKIINQLETLKHEDPFADPDHSNDNAAIDTDVREQVGHENIEAQIKNLQIRLEEINYALGKIKKDKYGLCDHCKKPISKARLELIPEARYCIACENKLRIG